MKDLPRYFALVGEPGAGKTTLQNILWEKYDVNAVDDGKPLREFAARHLSNAITLDDCYSESGKNKTFVFCGRVWTLREFLGEFGAALEDKFGPNVMPELATRDLSKDTSYSFASVRRDQALWYKEKGGVVLGVCKAESDESEREYWFDAVNAEHVDYWIENPYPFEEPDVFRAMSVFRTRVDAIMQRVKRDQALRVA